MINVSQLDDSLALYQQSLLAAICLREWNYECDDRIRQEGPFPRFA